MLLVCFCSGFVVLLASIIVCHVLLMFSPCFVLFAMDTFLMCSLVIGFARTKVGKVTCGIVPFFSVSVLLFEKPCPERTTINTMASSTFSQGAAKGVRQKELDHFFFRFRDAFGHFSVTFSDASVTFFVTFVPNSFCRTPFAAG